MSIDSVPSSPPARAASDQDMVEQAAETFVLSLGQAQFGFLMHNLRAEERVGKQLREAFKNPNDPNAVPGLSV